MEQAKLSRSAIRSRTLICHALIELSLEKDFKDITITEVAEKAGVNRNTFYAHYSNLSDVKDEIEEKLTDYLDNLLDNFSYSAITPETVVRHLTAMIRTVYSKLPSPMLIDGLLHLFPHVCDVYFERCLQVIPASQLHHDSLEVQLKFTIEGVKGVLTYWVNQKAPTFTLDQLEEELLRFVGTFSTNTVRSGE